MIKSFEFKTVFALLAVLSGSCATVNDLTSAKATPSETAAQVAKAGPLPPIEVVAPTCDYVSVELRFRRESFRSESERDALIGKGNPITIRVSIARVDRESGKDNLVEHQTWITASDAIQGWANDYVFRSLGGSTLPRGSYRVIAEVMDSHPKLEGVRPTLAVVSNFKNSPDWSKC